MTIEETLTWPFFDEKHRAFAAALARWADATLPGLPHGEHSDVVDAACRSRVKALGEAGFLKAVVGSRVQPPRLWPGIEWVSGKSHGIFRYARP